MRPRHGETWEKEVGAGRAVGVHALRRGGRRLLEEGEGPDGWAPHGGEREEGRREATSWAEPKRGEGRRGPGETRPGQMEGDEKKFLFSNKFSKLIFK